MYEPTAGDVIRYDFLWKEEHLKGQIDGAKDRPCAVVLTTKQLKSGSKQVVVVPITHTPPSPKDKNNAIELPAKVLRHLGLDDNRSWIKTD